MPENLQRANFWETLFSASLPRTHLFAAGAVAVLVTFLLVIAPSEDVSAYRESRFDAAATSKAALDIDLEAIETASNSNAEAAAPLEPEQTLTQLDEEIRPGDSLSEIFKRLSLSPSQLYAVANSRDFAEELTRLKPGETISVVLDDEKNINEVVYQRSPLELFRYRPTETGYHGEKLSKEPQTTQAYRHATIHHSLFLDGEKAGLSHSQILQIATIFGWDIDFALDIHEGDTFSVLYEEQYLDGQKIGSGKVLAAEFTNQGTVHKAVYYVDKEGNSNYYSPQGQPMKKAFLRAPLDFTRVSSNFNPNRLHPVFKTRRPHRGVDYAARKGTPVYAAGDGRVVKAGYTPANGNYIVIQHGASITTKYLHLNTLAVKQGRSIKQRQVIGTVGSTGYATGPHLHYEFLINGEHTNPRTVKLPQAEPIGSAELARFDGQTKSLLAALEQSANTQLAALDKK